MNRITVYLMTVSALFSVPVSNANAFAGVYTVDNFEMGIARYPEDPKGWEITSGAGASVLYEKAADAKEGAGAMSVKFNASGNWAVLQKIINGNRLDAKKANAVSFWIKGDGSGSSVTVELGESYDAFKWRRTVNLDSTGWQKIIIPFFEFICLENKKDKMSIKGLNVFKFVAFNDAWFIVDEIEFLGTPARKISAAGEIKKETVPAPDKKKPVDETSEVPPPSAKPSPGNAVPGVYKVDDFEGEITRYPENPGGWEVTKGAGANVLFEPAPGAKQGAGALNVKFTASGSWGVLQKKINGSRLDAGKANAVSFWIKGDGSGASVTVEIGESYDAFKWRSTVSLDSTGWRQVVIPLDEFTCLENKKDKMSIKGLDVFKFVAFDDIEFVVDGIEFQGSGKAPQSSDDLKKKTEIRPKTTQTVEPVLSRAMPYIQFVKPSALELPKFSTLYLDIGLSIPYNNPFDPEDVSVNVEMKSPAGKSIQLPAFFLDSDNKNSNWQARFTPVETGRYSYSVSAVTGESELRSENYSLSVTPSEKDGFIRINPFSSYSFIFDSGKPFRGIGENLAWTRKDVEVTTRMIIDDYEKYFKRLAGNGCNLARIWMWPVHQQLENKSTGMGKYNLENARLFDRIIELAEKYNIYIILCLENYSMVRESGDAFGNNEWKNNPYNRRNGGIVETASEFFTSSEAIKYLQNRYRYLIARYGYSTHILAWELFNEVDHSGIPDELIVYWHKKMTSYLKKNDTYQHLVTTSFREQGNPDVWRIPEIDFTQSHHYNMAEVSQYFHKIIVESGNEYQKPHIIGEFGADWHGDKETRQADPYNTAIHNGLWAGFFSPTPVTPLTWYWDKIIEEDNLYYHFKGLYLFSRDIFAQGDNIKPLNIQGVIVESNQNSPERDEGISIYPSTSLTGEKIEINTGAQRPSPNNYVIDETKGFGKNISTVFTINGQDPLENELLIPSYLYGSSKSELKNPPVFDVTYKTPGRFIVKVGELSEDGLLKIYLNGELRLEKPLPLGEGEGEWEKSVWSDEWNKYQGEYNKEYGIVVPAGNQRIRVENAGKDWIKIDMYKLENCGYRKWPYLQVKGLKNNNNMYLWIKNSDYRWKKTAKNGLPDPVVSMPVIKIQDVLRGKYKIEWWDTVSGKITQSDSTSVHEDGTMKISVPRIQMDIAAKIVHQTP